MSVFVVDRASPAEAHPETHRDGQRRSVDALLVSLIALPLALWAVRILQAGHAWLSERLPDDAYYYLEIGRRLARDGTSSVDGIHSTNGYHPLWQLLVAALARLFSGDSLVKAVLLLGLATVGAGAVALVRLLSPALGRRPALAGVAIALHAGALPLLINGMETPAVFLAACLVGLAVRAVVRSGDRRDVRRLGAACALLVLARLDFLLVIPVVPLVLGLWRERKQLLTWLQPFALLGLLLIYSWLHFGLPLTVSGTLKLDASSSLAARSGGWLSPGYARVVLTAITSYAQVAMQALGGVGIAGGSPSLSQRMGAAVVAAGLAGLAMRWRRRGVEVGGLAVVLLVLGAKAAVDLLVLTSWSVGWYAGPFIVIGGATLVAAAGGAWLEAVSARIRTRLALPVVVLLAIPTQVPNTRLAQVDATTWQGGIDVVAKHLLRAPVPGRLGAYDSGLLAYELDPVPVVNLDGLVNDAAQARAIMRGATADELVRRNGIDFLVGRLADGDPRIPGCATELWRSEQLIGYADLASGPSFVPMRILDVRCTRR